MKMLRKIRGFRLSRHRLVKVFKLFFHWKTKFRATYKRLSKLTPASRAVAKFCSLGRLLKHGRKKLLFFRKHSGYIRVEQKAVKPVSVPKGHLAVYVGDTEDDTCRVFVPVIYFNHPLFVDLLREAEKVYGFNHQGGIQIPCQKSRFEHVKTRIAATSGGGRCRRQWAWIKG